MGIPLGGPNNEDHIFCGLDWGVPGFFFPRVGSAWALELVLAPWSRGPLVP